jgi:hypothetical protein
MSDRWWEEGGSPPMKPKQPVKNPASFWMDPDLGTKIKIGLSIVFVLLTFVMFGFGGAVVGFLLAIFLTKPTSNLHRW